ncbi:MAG: C2 domain-containing protein [Phycisphaera sp.]|nr:MAG: C2 domain-containing protein [Phycisphaera sp.]
MKLRGLLDSSLGGFLCIRGYAPLGELARCSVADDSYQRDLITTHQERIREFLADGENLFFPEVTLACRLQYDPDRPRAKSGIQILASVRNGDRFKSNVNQIEITSTAKKFQSPADVRAYDTVRVATLDIPDDLIDAGSGPLSRIDGNHRISAHDLQPSFAKLRCPFCVILFDSSDEDRRKSKTIFHNVNFKSIPLTAEQHLKVVFDDVSLFPDEMLKSSRSFGESYVLGRHATANVDLSAAPAMSTAVDGKRRTLFHKLYELLIQHGHAVGTVDLQSALARVNSFYLDYPTIAEKKCFGLVLALAYYAATNDADGRFNSFKRWVVRNHIAEMAEADAASLVAIFNRVYEARSRTVFVSMPFNKSTDSAYEAIKAAVGEVNSRHHPGIELEQLRIDKYDQGHSFRINDKILEMIDDAGLLIADLTQGNPNVYHEIGYMMGLNRGRRRPQDNFILIVDGTDPEQVRKDVGFNLQDWQQVRFTDTLGLTRQLYEKLCTHYKLDPNAESATG